MHDHPFPSLHLGYAACTTLPCCVRRHNDIPRSVNGFQNVDNVSCYANATIQCIFHCAPITQILIAQRTTDVFQTLFISYTRDNKQVLDTFAVREFVGTRFTCNMQQDASEFLSALCTKSDTVRSSVEHRLLSTIRCKTCNDTKLPNVLTSLFHFHCLLLLKKSSIYRI